MVHFVRDGLTYEIINHRYNGHKGRENQQPRSYIIDELLRDKKQPPESQFAKARRLIESALRDGPVPAADMEQMAEEQGISPKTLHRAKSALGVISVKRGGGWLWELPIEAEFTECREEGQHGQDGQDSPMTALTIFPQAEAG